MLTVHHLGLSQSERIVWLCEELDIPYALKRYEREPVNGLAPPEYRALHPSGTAPIITDGALTLAESGAIMEYIIHTYGKGRLAVAPGKPNYADYLFWFHFANGSFMPAATLDALAAFLKLDKNGIAGLLAQRNNRAFEMVEQRLGTAPYLAGEEFTAADIITFYPLTTIRALAPRDLSSSPRIKAYVARVGARPAYQRAMKKSDPDFKPLLS